MTEAVVHTVPAETNIVEEAHTALDHLRMFASRNRDTLILLSGMFLSQFVCRAMFRRELTRLHFNVEVFPYENITSTDFEYDDD